MNSEEREFFTPQELADLLRTTRATIYEYIKAGKLKGVKLGNRRLFPREEVAAFLETKTGVRLQRRAQPDPEELIEAREMLKEGDALRKKQAGKESIEAGAALRKIFAKTDDKQGLAHALFIEGSGYMFTGNYTRSQKRLNEALEAVLKSDDRMLQGQITGTLGQLNKQHRHFDDAVKYFHNSLEIFRDLGARDKVANAYHGLGTMYKGIGNPIEGLNNLKMAYEVARSIKVPPTFLPRLLTSIADAHFELGDLPQALNIAERAKNLALKRDLKIAVAQALSTMGKTLHELGDISGSKEYFRQCLTIIESQPQIVQDSSLATSQNAAQGLEDFPRLLQILKRQEDLMEKGPENRGYYGGLLRQFAVCHLGLNEPSRALDIIDKAIAEQDKAGALSRRWLYHWVRAKCFSALDQPVDACESYKEAFFHLGQETLAAANEGITGPFEHYYEAYTEDFLKTTILCPDDDKSLEYSLGISAMDTRGVIARGAIYPDPVRERVVCRKYIRNESAITDYFQEMSKVLPGMISEYRIKEHLDRQQRLREKRGKLVSTLIKDNPSFLPLQGEEGPSLNEIKKLFSQKKVPRDASIYFCFLGRESGQVFIANRTGIVVREKLSIGKEKAAKFIRSFLCECRMVGDLIREGKTPSLSEQQNLKSTLKTLYELLIKPVGGSLDPAKPVLVITDNSLQFLPFNALYDGERFLCEYFRISRFMSPAFLRLTGSPGGNDNRKPRLLVVSPEAEAEMEPILGNLRNIPRKQMGWRLGEKAVVSKVRSHIAKYDAFIYSGGVFPHTKTPQKTNLTMNEGPGLAANELFSQRYDLSGVKAAILHYGGMNIDQPGASFQPIERGFLTAGAQMVASFLWELDRANLGRILGEIFRDFRSLDWTGTEAIRQAQIKMINDPLTSHPYFWAGIFPHILTAE